MHAGTIFQENGRLYFQLEIKELPTVERLNSLYEEAYKQAAKDLVERTRKAALQEGMILTSLEAASIMGYTTTDKVHEYAELDRKDPEHLKCIWHEEKRYRRFRLSAIIEWAEAHEDESILQRARNFRYKPKRKKSTKSS